MSVVQQSLGLLGLRVTDKVTGFSGVVTSIAFDLYGCVQAVVKPPVGEDGKQRDGEWFDVARLHLASVVPVMDRPEKFTLNNGPSEKPSGHWR
jgi:hypothetical protein